MAVQYLGLRVWLWVCVICIVDDNKYFTKQWMSLVGTTNHNYMHSQCMHSHYLQHGDARSVSSINGPRCKLQSRFAVGCCFWRVTSHKTSRMIHQVNHKCLRRKPHWCFLNSHHHQHSIPAYIRRHFNHSKLQLGKTTLLATDRRTTFHLLSHTAVHLHHLHYHHFHLLLLVHSFILN